MSNPIVFTPVQIRDALSSYAMQATDIYRDSIWLYAIPDIFKRPTNEKDEPLVDALIEQLISEEYLVPSEHDGIYRRSDKATHFLRKNRILI